jgi:hypothetical protein
MYKDAFAERLAVKVNGADNRVECQNITIDLLLSKPIEQDRYWWTGRAIQLCNDKDRFIGWKLSQEKRIEARGN